MNIVGGSFELLIIIIIIIIIRVFVFRIIFLVRYVFWKWKYPIFMEVITIFFNPKPFSQVIDTFPLHWYLHPHVDFKKDGWIVKDSKSLRFSWKYIRFKNCIYRVQVVGMKFSLNNFFASNLKKKVGQISWNINQ